MKWNLRPLEIKANYNAEGAKQLKETSLSLEFEDEHRRKMRNFFDSLDINHDGTVNVQELQYHMQNFLGPKLSTCIASQILKKYDADFDGMLSFEEFYQMSLQKDCTFNRIIFKYCQLVVPPRIRREDSVDSHYEDSLKFWPPPLTMISFSIVQIIIFYISVCHNEYDECKEFFSFKSNKEIPVDNSVSMLLRYDPFERNEIWRFVTYMFVHSSILHLIGNVFMQIFLGVPLELVHSWWRVALVYLAGGLAGSMGHSLTGPIALVGASGGVYALIIAHIATVIMNWKEMYNPLLQLTIFLIYCVTDFYFSFIAYHAGNLDTSFVSHLCGAIAGLLVGIGVLRNLKIRSWEQKMWWCAITIFAMLLLIGGFINIFYLHANVQVDGT